MIAQGTIGTSQLAAAVDVDKILRSFKLHPKWLASWSSYRWSAEEIAWILRQAEQAAR